MAGFGGVRCSHMGGGWKGEKRRKDLCATSVPANVVPENALLLLNFKNAKMV